ncbi:hypothetical protein [Chamaesiphon polymorphus]|uniref:Organic solvent tolerance-like N-terminal domain-containing protein n=1 Tax=Chamaesiphon polymorphus CCALA 037 TaxID=2107692 RepID=A0A2T1GFM9_9CYAN|nr:hypothetical protein [Chamaesiphon polymorphus]PSB56416.1 hypothetical protein C7B77_11960 [Chamaesiphon polymorphus CCALA 037]
MSHRKFWVLGITSILLISNLSQARAEFDDDNIEIRSGKVRIIRDADGNTQIETDRIKVQSEPSRLRHPSKSRHSIRQRRLNRASVATKKSAETSLNRETTIRQTNNSYSSPNSQINNQTTRIRGNNRTIIQSSIDNPID